MIEFDAAVAWHLNWALLLHYYKVALCETDLFNEVFVPLFATDAANNARFLCDQFYCASPEFEISEVNG